MNLVFFFSPWRMESCKNLLQQFIFNLSTTNLLGFFPPLQITVEGCTFVKSILVLTIYICWKWISVKLQLWLIPPASCCLIRSAASRCQVVVWLPLPYWVVITEMRGFVLTKVYTAVYLHVRLLIKFPVTWLQCVPSLNIFVCKRLSLFATFWLWLEMRQLETNCSS